MRRLTTAKFVEKAIAVHGTRFNYSRVEYTNNSTPVQIVCSDHGEFWQRPHNHLSGNGCSACAGTKKPTRKSFIDKARVIHGDRYDYSQVEYANAKTHVTIVCLDHGPFTQQPSHHLANQGCPECGGKKQLTTVTFVVKAKAVHCDRYDYSQTEYANSKTPITIICRDHGRFLQSPGSHLQGRGCPVCAGTQSHTTDSFILRAKSLHDDRYEYSSVNYVNAFTNVTIICPEHGPFEQLPANHFKGSGCPICSGNQPLTTESFIEKARAIHRDRYGYSEVEYEKSNKRVTIICPDHGEFRQRPNNHLMGDGCPECGGSMVLTTESFIERSIAVHGDRYDYSATNYVNAHTVVVISCPDHGQFKQTPSNNLSGKGCPDCAETGFNPNDRATLYYLAITTNDGDTRYKIGITNKSVEERFRAPDLARIRIVKIWNYAIGRVAAEREAEILRLYAGERYYGPDILKSGNSELFTSDVLGLDK